MFSEFSYKKLIQSVKFLPLDSEKKAAMRRSENGKAKENSLFVGML